jgi:hypothetical protein
VKKSSRPADKAAGATSKMTTEILSTKPSAPRGDSARAGGRTAVTTFDMGVRPEWPFGFQAEGVRDLKC